MSAQQLTASRVVELILGEYESNLCKKTDEGLNSEYHESGGAEIWNDDHKWGGPPNRLEVIDCCINALMARMEGQTDEEIIEYFGAYGPNAVARWNEQKAKSPFIPVFTSDEIPDTTYFRVADAQPEFADSDGTINPSLDDRKAVKVWSGIGTYRSSWGAPKVTSTVLVNDPNLTLLCIHVGFSHKHRGSQFYRYYTMDMGIVVETSWKRLSNEQRQAVLDAPKPDWAKVPGKLHNPKKA